MKKNNLTQEYLKTFTFSEKSEKKEQFGKNVSQDLLEEYINFPNHIKIEIQKQLFLSDALKTEREIHFKIENKKSLEAFAKDIILFNNKIKKSQ